MTVYAHIRWCTH